MIDILIQESIKVISFIKNDDIVSLKASATTTLVQLRNLLDEIANFKIYYYNDLVILILMSSFYHISHHPQVNQSLNCI